MIKTWSIETHKQAFIKLLLLCALLIGYFAYLSYEYDVLTGGFAALLSCSGTFLSVYFGDALMDVVHHRDRHFFHSHHFKRDLIMVAFFILIFFGYYALVASLGIDVSR